jgi:hypothetical protein
LALLLPAVAAAAPGLNLAWSTAGGASACPTNSGALEDMADPCDDTGFEYLVGSVRAPSGLTQVTGEEAYLDMQVENATLPDFWQLQVGGCGDGKLLMEAVFTGFSTGTAATQCSNYWGTAASGGFNWAPYSTNRARLAGVFARTPSSAGPMTADRQYYIFRASLTTDHASTCTGCSMPACFVFNTLILTQPVGVGDAVIENPDVRRFVTWQGGLTGGCDPVPARRSSWGQVKSLYR